MNNVWHWTANSQDIILWSPDDQAILRFDINALWASKPGRIRIRRRLAWDFITESTRSRVNALIPQMTDKAQVTIPTTDPHTAIVMTLKNLSSWHAEISIQSTNEEMKRVHLGFHTSTTEHWRGFGEHGHTIMPPARFDTWVEEGPVGLGPLSPWLRFTGRVPIPKGPYPSYATLPLWLSSAGYGAWFENSELLRWQIQSTLRTVKTWTNVLTLHVVVGHSPLQVLERQSLVLKRATLPPDWIFGPWNDSVRGQSQAESLASHLRQERIPSSALWIEDWMGSWEDSRRFWMRPLSHKVDTLLYPDLPSLSDDLHRTGFRLLGYFCPEISKGSSLYQSALEQGLLVKDQSGDPIIINVLGIDHGEVDFTHPEAEAWIHQQWFQPAYGQGFDGWMADFGEYLPTNAVLHDGSHGWQRHNLWPLLWQKVNRTFWDQKRPNGDYTFFVRSASLGSQHVAPILWGGDSDTDFDPADGLPTVVPQVLSAQLAGFNYWATDIAGYMTFGLTRPSTKNLYIRWLQLASLLPVMRTHHGTARPRNWHWNRDLQTRSIYTRYARLHTSLFPFWHHLSRLATTRGYPLIRALFLEFPQDPVAWIVDQEFLVGDRLLVAPVIKPQGSRHRVYIPPGRWRYWWSQRIDIGPGWIHLDVPLDQLPLWIRVGYPLPMFEGVPLVSGDPEGIVDSLADIDQGPGVDLRRATRHLTIYLAGNLESSNIFLPGGGCLELSFNDKLTFKDCARWPVAHAADHLPQEFGMGWRTKLAPGAEARYHASAQGTLIMTASPDSIERYYAIRWIPATPVI